MSEPIRSGATVAKNARVQSCPMCGGCGWLTRAYARVGEFGRVDCVLCSGTGRVVGVPKGSIVVADDTGRVAVVPKMEYRELTRRLIESCKTQDKTGEEAVFAATAKGAWIWRNRAIAINFALKGAPQEEAPDAAHSKNT